MATIIAKDNKKRLFEMMAIVDKNFKKPLNENMNNSNYNKYIRFYELSKDTTGEYFDEYENLSNELFGDHTMPDVLLALDHFQTPIEFADYMIKRNDDGDILMSKTPLNRSQAERDDERGYAQKYKIGEANVAEDVDRNDPNFKLGGMESQYKSILNDVRNLSKYLETNPPIEGIKAFVSGILKYNTDLETNIDEAKYDGINRKYTHFATLKSNDKILNGWDYKNEDPEDLKQDKKIYFFQDIKDMDIDTKLVNIYTRKQLEKKGINPFDTNNWFKFEAEGWRGEPSELHV